MIKHNGRPMTGISRQLVLMARAAGVDLRLASLQMHNVCSNISAHLAMLEKWGYLTSRKAPGQLKRYFVADDASKADAWQRAMTAQACGDAEANQMARQDALAKKHKKARSNTLRGSGTVLADDPVPDAAQAAPAVEQPPPVLAGRRGAVPLPWQGPTFSGLGVGRYLPAGPDA